MTHLQYNYGTASLLEIIWTAFALIGTGITFELVREALEDLASLHRNPTFHKGGDRDIVAHMNLRNMWIRLVMLTAFGVAGVAGMLTPPASTVGPPTPGSVIIGGSFILAEMLTLGSAVWDRTSRQQLFYQIRTRKMDELKEKAAQAVAKLDQESTDARTDRG